MRKKITSSVRSEICLDAAPDGAEKHFGFWATKISPRTGLLPAHGSPIFFDVDVAGILAGGGGEASFDYGCPCLNSFHFWAKCSA
jgi:hypothetical protein